MTPLEIRRLVGHPDIVERPARDFVDLLNMASEQHPLDAPMHLFGEAADEIAHLRTALRAVRGSSDPAWQARLIDEALGETTP